VARVSGGALVTGAAGFAGGHLTSLLLDTNPVIHAWTHARTADPPVRDPRVFWTALDVLDRAAVTRALAAAEPEVIYHCAGVADVHGAWRAPAGALRVNVLGTLNLLEAAAAIGAPSRILVTGSALVYKPGADAIDEDHPIGPSTPYGVSKLAQEMVALASSLDVIVTRAFNHAGPRQSDAFVASAFARQIAEIEAGVREPVLKVGNLESRRDITDVRDTVRAYRALVERGQRHRPYNVCSGTAHRVGDLLDALLRLARVPVEVRTDPARLRPSDNPVVLGSHDRLTRETGWTPQIPIAQTLADILDDWRKRSAV
jgi:GDP-4-dehydro-6-deoxy-D-mannose reductase